jgi:hypothetical protein
MRFPWLCPNMDTIIMVGKSVKGKTMHVEDSFGKKGNKNAEVTGYKFFKNSPLCKELTRSCKNYTIPFQGWCPKISSPLKTTITLGRHTETTSKP